MGPVRGGKIRTAPHEARAGPVSGRTIFLQNNPGTARDQRVRGPGLWCDWGITRQDIMYWIRVANYNWTANPCWIYTLGQTGELLNLMTNTYNMIRPSFSLLFLVVYKFPY